MTTKEYAAIIESLAKDGGKDYETYNSGPEHASIVLTAMFKYSNSEIKMHTGGFDGSVSNKLEYLNALDDYLSKENTKLYIIVDDYENNKEKFIYSIFKKHPSKVELYDLGNKYSVKIIENSDRIHFSIGDSRSIRLEYDTKNYSAYVNFKTNVSYYEELFDELKRKALKVELS